MKEPQEIKINRYSDSGRESNFHHVYIHIPNDSCHISNNGDSITIHAKWDATRFNAPSVTKG